MKLKIESVNTIIKEEVIKVKKSLREFKKDIFENTMINPNHRNSRMRGKRKNSSFNN